jgi:putative DNA methylase
VFGLAEPIGYRCTDSFEEFEQRGRIYLACGNSNSTDVAAKSVDAVLTDPPFFDNVHYSQLADFFHVWQRHILGAAGCRANATTRATGEVQHSEGNVFQARLRSVWEECHRVLKDDGLLVFTYHHSRTDGWRCILQALMDAGFHVVAAHPIKAEMSVAAPKRQAKQPIDLDIIIVCRKTTTSPRRVWNGDILDSVAALADRQLKRLRASNRSLSRNDIRIVVMSHLLRQLSLLPNTDAALDLLDAHEEGVERIISALFDGDNGGQRR